MKKFEIYYPVKPLHFNQNFGNHDPKYTNLGLVGHNGIDFMAAHGQSIYAAHDGIAYYEIDNGGGHGVVMRTNEQFDYNGTPAYFKTIYWHLCDSNIEPRYKSPVEGIPDGLQVKAGDLIGYADNTGLSTGDHLHFGVKVQGQNESNGAWYNVEQNNGYLGAIDPTPYFNGKFAEDIKKPAHYIFNKDMGRSILYKREVLELQKRLVEEGYADFTPIGIYGPKTIMAVKSYQGEHGIPTTGFTGPLTRAALNTS